MLNGGDIAVNNTTLAANVASFQFADRPGGWGGGIYVDKASKASIAYATIVLNTARFAAGVASNNTVTVLASLLSGNLGASKAGECGGTGRLESKGWNLLMEMGDWPLHVACGRLEPRPARGGCDVGAFERQPDDVMP